MNSSLLDTIHSLEKRAKRLEREAAALRHELTRVAQELAEPPSVATTYIVNGNPVSITQQEVDAVRGQMTRPRSENVLRELALAYKLAADSPPDESVSETNALLVTLESARAAALADGTAIDEELEAALDD